MTSMRSWRRSLRHRSPARSALHDGLDVVRLAERHDVVDGRLQRALVLPRRPAGVHEDVLPARDENPDDTATPGDELGRFLLHAALDRRLRRRALDLLAHRGHEPAAGSARRRPRHGLDEDEAGDREEHQRAGEQTPGGERAEHGPITPCPGRSCRAGPGATRRVPC
jgi:hypothetical protein